jgi:hypothetical protein
VISGISRRGFLGVLPLALAGQVRQPLKKAKPLPLAGEFVRVVDPVTENVIVRLTTPTSTSLLPYARNRFVSARERSLLFSSDRSGHFAPFSIDLRSGVIRQLADAAKLTPRSLCFDRQEKSALYLDGESLFEVSLAHGAAREIASGVSAFSPAADGSIFLISGGKLLRDKRTLADAANNLWPQPNSAGCLYSEPAGGLYYVPTSGSSKPSLVASGVASGQLRDPFWDAAGEAILFLRDVTSPNGTVLAEIHGAAVPGGDEYVVSSTSQFACFAPNSDASVFVGASRSKAQPNIVLMLRQPHREMTLCEHRATHPAEVTPVFSPDNRRIYFESDHTGKSAIYSVNVELLVEPQEKEGS